MSIVGNMAGCYSPIGKTFVLEDADGNEFTGVVVDQEMIFTANASSDIREGKVAATDAGVVTGSAVIPNYETCTGQKIIMAGDQFKITLTLHDLYDYTELQCIVCPFNSSINESVSAEKVVIGDNVYNSNSVAIAATVVKNAEDKSIDFNLTNTTDIQYIIRFFTYKELYGDT